MRSFVIAGWWDVGEIAIDLKKNGKTYHRFVFGMPQIAPHSNDEDEYARHYHEYIRRRTRCLN